ncbi:MAG: exo-alpha-sialidase, partial [Dehalococcoidia bacterium]
MTRFGQTSATLVERGLFLTSCLLLLFIFIAPPITTCPVYADWGTDTRLSMGTNLADSPDVAVSGDSVHAVWNDNRDGNLEIYYKRSNDGGQTWGTDNRLTNDPANSTEPVVAASGSNIHVTWKDDRDGYDQVYYKRSADGGQTWTSDARISPGTGTSDGEPAIAVSGMTVYIVWQGNRNGFWAIYYKRSADGGQTWSNEAKLSTGALNSVYPDVAVSNNDINVVWEDDRDGNFEIYAKFSHDEGQTWGNDARLTFNPAFSMFPAIEAPGNYVHVAWVDSRDGANQIYYKHSTDGGQTWGVDTRISTGTAGISPAVAVF